MTEPKEEATKGKYSYRFSLSVGFSGAERSEMLNISDLGLDEDEWDDLLEESRRGILDEHLQDWRAGLISSGWEVEQ